ncbi:MAG: flagellar biosynthetic protein FliO [Treponema sp.]|nr:flagellar biosynthetic protein FliO [Treponema sp.]
MAGFLVIQPLIYSQEEPGLSGAEEILTEEDPFRIAEQSYTFGEDTAGTNFGAGPGIWDVVRMLLVLAFAAAAIYGVVFLLKRASRQTPNKDPYLKILATSHLGANRYVHIVSVGSKAWLLGASDGGVNIISEIDEKEVVDAMLLDDSRITAESAQGRFPDFLAMMRRFGISAGAGKQPGADEIRKRRERLKGL